MISRVFAIGALGSALAFSQAAIPDVAKGNDPELKANYTPPKTSWGDPDLQGIWPLNHLIAVPLERQKQYGNRAFMSEEEYSKVPGAMERLPVLKQQYDEAWDLAAQEDQEKAAVRFVPRRQYIAGSF